MQFQFKDTRKSLEILDKSGEVVKTFYIDVGNYDQLKIWSSSLSDLENAGKLIEEGSGIDELVESFKKIVPIILGSEAWELIWNLSNRNIIICTAFMRKVHEFILEQMKEIRKDYA